MIIGSKCEEFIVNFNLINNCMNLGIERGLELGLRAIEARVDIAGGCGVGLR